MGFIIAAHRILRAEECPTPPRSSDRVGRAPLHIIVGEADALQFYGRPTILWEPAGKSLSEIPEDSPVAATRTPLE